jgi:hypothetical protein
VCVLGHRNGGSYEEHVSKDMGCSGDFDDRCLRAVKSCDKSLMSVVAISVEGMIEVG